MTRRRTLFQAVLTTVVLLLALSRCRDTTPPATELTVPTVDLGVSDEPVAFVGAGDIARCDKTDDEATAALIDGIPGTVFVLGDNAYPYGSATDYACFEASWGRHKSRIKPAAGDLDYSSSSSAAPYFTTFGAAAGDPTKGYYSYNLGAWHIAVINTKLSTSAGSAQDLWLKADLKNNMNLCTMVIGHYPRFYAGSSSGRTGLRPIWKSMYDAGAEVYVSSHTKIYERFAPQDTAANPDPATGITQFIIGTGGISHGSISSTIAKNSLVRDKTSFGVMKFTLNSDSYSWEFVPIPGNTFRDAGTTSCHRGRPPIANAGGPYQADGPVTFDASASVDRAGNTPLTYAWDFGDGQTGAGVKPVHEYASDATYTVTLTVTNSRGASSTITTTAISGNQPPTVNAGRDWPVGPGQTYTLGATFKDPGANDAPWQYTVDWGDGSAPESNEIRQQGSLGATHVYTALGQYTVKVTVTDKDGGSGWDDVTVTVMDDPPAFLIAAGDIGDCGSSSGDEKTAALIDGIVGTVAPLGDNAYSDGTATNYAQCYHPSWGRHKDRTRPTPGNDDYHETNAPGYFGYFGAAAGTPAKGFYSYELGAWHIVVLNTNISMSAGSEQDLWLRADLAAHPTMCTLAYWHHSRFNSTRGPSTRPAGGWRALYDAGADVILSAHEHNYERFAPQDPNGVADAVRGIRQFVVGTGGHHSLYPFQTIAANSEVRIAGTFGVIKMTLYAARYEWQYIPVAGSTAPGDAGSGACH